MVLGEDDQAGRCWRTLRGAGPIVATAIHDGHELRDELQEFVALDDAQRLREEDPFTAKIAQIAPTQVVGLRSRFEVDLNRPRAQAVYRRPEDAWGLEVWKHELPAEVVDRSLGAYDAFYKMTEELLREVHARYGRFVVFDLHSYTHRRDGREAAPADPAGNPQVNLGTESVDRAAWGPLVDRFREELAAFPFPGGTLDVRENIKFRGGNFSRWINRTFAGEGVSLAIEFKKFFMDEWSGVPDQTQIDSICEALASTVPGILEEL